MIPSQISRILTSLSRLSQYRDKPEGTYSFIWNPNPGQYLDGRANVRTSFFRSPANTLASGWQNRALIGSLVFCSYPWLAFGPVDRLLVSWMRAWSASNVWFDSWVEIALFSTQKLFGIRRQCSLNSRCSKKANHSRI